MAPKRSVCGKHRDVLNKDFESTHKCGAAITPCSPAALSHLLSPELGVFGGRGRRRVYCSVKMCHETGILCRRIWSLEIIRKSQLHMAYDGRWAQAF